MTATRRALTALLAATLPLLPARAEPSAKDLEAMVAAYTPKSWTATSLGQFFKMQHLRMRPALTWLASLDEHREKEANPILSRLHRKELDGWGIHDFKVQADWAYAGNDMHSLIWPTLPRLLSEMRTHLAAAHGKPHEKTTRGLYAQLLGALLPIYFVKAANIGTILDVLKAMPNGFADLVCPHHQDYAPKKSEFGEGDPSGALDCGRGFLVKLRRSDGLPTLVITFNPEAAIPQAVWKPVADAIAHKYE